MLLESVIEECDLLRQVLVVEFQYDETLLIRGRLSIYCSRFLLAFIHWMSKRKVRTIIKETNGDLRSDNEVKQDVNNIYINKEGDTVEAPEFNIATPKQSTFGGFNMNKLELFKACPELYDQCEEMGELFVLAAYDPSRYKSEVHNLREFLLHFHQTHRIKLDFPLWFKLIFSCLEPTRVSLQEVFEKNKD